MISALLVMCIGELGQPNSYCMQYIQPLLVPDQIACVNQVAAFLNSDTGQRRLEEGWYLYDFRCVDWLENKEGDPV